MPEPQPDQPSSSADSGVQAPNLGFGRHAVGRADLLRLLALGIEPECAAELAGFERSERKLGTLGALGQPPPSELVSGELTSKLEPADAAEPLAPPLLRAIGPIVNETALHVGPKPPDWFFKTPLRDADEFKPKSTQVMVPTPLIPRSRLGPVLRQMLGQRRQSALLDAPRLVREVASCRVLRRVPRRTKLCWPTRLQLLWDQATVMQPCFFDQLEVKDWLRRVRGTQGLEELVVDAQGQVRWYRRLRAGRQAEAARPRPADRGTTLLALSDLGMAHKDSSRQQLWRQLARKAKRRGAQCHALLLCPEARFEPTLVRLWQGREWERARPTAESPCRSPRQLSAGSSPKKPGEQNEPANEAADRNRAALDELFALLAPAIRVEPALLRALRLQLRSHRELSVELDAWMDERVRGRSALGMTLDYGSAKQARTRFAALPSKSRERVKAALRKYHASLEPIVLAEELLACGDAAAQQEATQRLAEYVRSLFERGVFDVVQFQGYVTRLQARQVEGAWGNEALGALWALAHRTEDGFDAPLPKGLDGQDIIWVLSQPPRPGWCRLWQQGAQLHLLPIEERQAPLPEGPGSWLCDLPLAVRELDIRWSEPAVAPVALAREAAVRLRVGERWPFPFSSDTPVLGHLDVATDLGQVKLVLQRKPSSDVYLERDTSGLWAHAGDERVRWPSWASHLEKDRFGWAAELELPGRPRRVTRLRWVPAGSFVMGSPAAELGRLRAEGPQHGVSLTAGFWLGETPCTQAEWEAVMGSRPSEFKGERLPVEQVSWVDCQEFCERLNERHAGLGARLPLESEWEYACRAGTESGYNDGSECTELEGSDPALMELGWFRENSDGQTHPVKGLRPNQWGLYDMHGNVWEWCADDQREYGAEAVTNPRGSEDDDQRRVSRGGSWSYTARYCRSAIRLRGHRVNRNSNLGFRLVTGQGSEPGGESGGGRSPEKSGAERREGAPRGSGAPRRAVSKTKGQRP